MTADGAARQFSVRRRRQGWLWLLVLSGALIALWLMGDDTTLALRYDREPVGTGEWWRLATCHLVHGNLRHLLLNLAGLGIIAVLFPAEYSLEEWLAVGLVSALGIGAGLWWLNPGTGWYVGLSGILHGALAAGAVAAWRGPSRLFAVGLSCVLVVKLAWEQGVGPIGWSSDLPVIADAHLYGALAGGTTGVALMLRRYVASGRRS